MNDDVSKIAQAIDWLVTQQENPPSLEVLAKRFECEPTAFQKLFKKLVGVSPKQLSMFMHYSKARDYLLRGYSTLDAAYEAGLSGQGRLHDLFLRIESMTPGEVKKRGKNITITYGFAPTFMGEIMVGKTAKGICWLGFQVNETAEISIQRMKSHWPLAVFIKGDVDAEVKAIHDIWRGHKNQLSLDIYGTNMQIQVWQALLKIPFGAVTDYKTIAEFIGKPKAARAVGNAVGSNPISLLIPCHRVIQASGIVNNYGWGSPRKKVILGIEGQENI